MRTSRLALLAASVLFLAAPAALADVLELKDGRFVEGAVTRSDESYVVRSRFGESTIPVADVKTWKKEKPVDDVLRERLAVLAEGDAEGRAGLARWLKGLGREEEGLALAQSALEIDPECATAHEVLGHVRHQGVWRTPDEAKRAEGLEKHGDRWYTPAEWANLAAGEREKEQAREKEAAAGKRAAEVNEAVRLMMSPDRALRARGRSALDDLAREYKAPELANLAKSVEAYVKASDELSAAAARGDSAFMLGELRITMTKLKRPIKVFETSLATGPIGAAAPVKIQLPELEVIRVNTTIGMPASTGP